ncbi:unnamed protein product [Rhizoctonia solani]|uniref:Titin n=1 Tax=Rhizoctonia solani TaxID=456999 RepID=A0A8H2WPZ3_9AGAM|nr:unnamed protein product [Rhizoctonia solani]
MKAALERLHVLGVDCIALVKQAAQTVGVSTNNLQETGPGDRSIPLFADGQPLDVWSNNLRVNRVEGDALIGTIWDSMKKKVLEMNLDVAELNKGSPKLTTDTPLIKKDQITNYGNTIPPVDAVQPATTSNHSIGDGATQHAVIAVQPHVTPGPLKLPNEPNPPSTEAPTQAPPAQIPPNPLPAPSTVPTLASIPPQTAPQPASTQHPADVAAWQSYQAQLARKYQYSPYPSGAQTTIQSVGPQRLQQAPTAAYVPPNLVAQVPIQVPPSQAPAQTSEIQSTMVKPKAKPRKTAALDYLRSLGIDIPEVGTSERPSGVPSKPPAESEPIRTKDKGKGKAIDPEVPVVPVVPTQPEPEPGPERNNTENAVPEPTPPVSATGPSRVLETPRSPVAPTIAVLAEPSPTPPPLSATETVTRPATPVVQAPIATHAPAPVPPVMTILADSGAPLEPTPPAVEASGSKPSAILEASAANTDPARPTSQASAILSPPIASISALALGDPSSPPEATPLKRKRESRLSDVNEAGPGPNTETRARQHAEVNKHDQKRPKIIKRDSTTTGAGNELSSSQLESPYPNIPLPANPIPNNSWAQSYASAMNSANRTDRPLFRPETPPSDEPSSPSTSKPKSVKRRMIMEVVIPVRKKKGKAVAADLTSDTGTERDDSLGLDELVNAIHDDTRMEQEPDLQLIRRRLRPHTIAGSSFAQATFELQGSKYDCDRTTSERYRMVVHVNRAHRENPDAKLRVFAQPEDFSLGRAESEERVVLRPDAFPDGVPYFRIMGMALRYEVVPAQIPSQRHARIGPIILRNISAPTGIVSVPRPAAGGRTRQLPLPPALASPVPPRSQVRLGTVPPDALGEEIEREAGPAPNKSPVRRISISKGTKASESSTKSRTNPSPARSHITITSDESSSEPESRRGSTAQGPGRGRGRGGTSVVRANRSIVSQSSQSSSPHKAPRLQLVVELPSRGSGSSMRK